MIAKQPSRVRNFAFILYEESSTEGWEDKLQNYHSKGFYVYHDQDLNADGSAKKPHYHILIMHDSPHSSKKIQEFVEQLGGANGVYQEVNSVRGYARYLCHLDNPEKHRYELSSVKSMGGTDYINYVKTEKEDIETLRDIIKYCRESNVYSYADLLEYCMDSKYEWFQILCGYKGNVIKDYIKSRYWTKFCYMRPVNEKNDLGM